MMCDWQLSQETNKQQEYKHLWGICHLLDMAGVFRWIIALFMGYTPTTLLKELKES